MIARDAIEPAYCFFHQKQRIYWHSTLDWQKDDIEMAVADYAESMNRELYSLIACGKADFLRDSATFSTDIANAVERLEQLI
jgi:hypothetical protein